ncbi:NUDIX domain-containing protein [Methanosphaera cuniculi]|uniref:NUDIX domain-containing protein n=1 Tax=Methanosphaera cuniculi TaxID=1077256 RepID=UPI0026EFAAE4|nr:NUDIX domain-containing protein [Methanosphaera cuniculi]
MSKFNMYVKTIIRNNEDKILLIRENRTDNKDRWDLPGAPLTDDESFDEALIENVQKQIGYYIYPKEIIGISNYKQYNSKNLTVIMDSIIFNGDLILSRDYNDYKWVNMEDINKYPLSLWLNNYIKTNKNPFHDVEEIIDELDDKIDVREAMIEENIATEDPNTFEEPQKKVGRSLKSSFGLFKDAIKRTFHPKRAKVDHTEPKENLYIDYENTEDEIEYEGEFSQQAQQFINQSRREDETILIDNNMSDDDIILTDNVPSADEILHSSGDEIIVEHDIETIIQPDSDDVVDDTGIINLDMSSDDDEIIVDKAPQELQKKSEDIKLADEIKAEEDKTDVEAVRSSIKDHEIKIISENQTVPYIRKEKESEEKVSFNSEGINRHNWKDKLDKFNRTKANDKKKQVPHPKGKR